MSHSWIPRAGAAAAGTTLLAAGLLGLGSPVDAATVPNGTVMHLTHQGKEYVAEHGTLHWVPNPQTFLALGLSWNHTVSVPSFTIPIGAPVQLVKTADNPAVYLEQGDVLHRIPNAATFDALGYHWRDVFTLTTLPLPIDTPVSASTPAASEPDGTVVHLPHQGKEFFVDHGTLHWIPNAPTFDALGLSWNHTVAVSTFTLPIGAPVQLVKTADNPAVYLEQGGALHRIPSAATFTALDYHWRDVFTVAYLPLPIGAPATNTLSPITYTNSQLSTIGNWVQKMDEAGLLIAYKGFNSRFLNAKIYKSAVSHGNILTLTYNNFTIQEARTSPFGTGGDRAVAGTVLLTIPGTGSQTVLGTWTKVYGIQGSGNHFFLTFKASGVYYLISSSKLSQSQINQIVEAFAEP
jgi:hypothetical protein